MAKPDKTVTREPVVPHNPPAGGMAEKAKAAAGLPAVTVNGTDAVKPLVPYVPPNVKVKKLVTIPVVKFPDGGTLVFSPMDEFRVGKDIKAENKKPADIVTVRTYDFDGKIVPRILVAGHIVKSELSEQYPKGAYIGLWFIARKLQGPEGKRYKVYDIAEIDDPTKTP